MSARVAVALATADLVESARVHPPPSRGPRRFFAVGDPQTSASRFFTVLETHGLLGDDGWLAPDVGLVSLGDHFDYADADLDRAGAEGARILAWLAAHARDQVRILVGNHDLARVMELAALDDPTFHAARDRAIALVERQRREGRESADVVARRAALRAEHPGAPMPELLARDYSCFSARQARLVRQLLVDGRVALAVAARLADTTPVLLSHASVTTRELAALGLDEDASPPVIARALNAFLTARVEDARARWVEGAPAPLDLAPLHVAGPATTEGAGLLYHRPAHPSRDEPHRPFTGPRRRRYAPEELPRGLVQACGHVSHEKCREELRGYPQAPVDDGALRVLTVDDDGPRYGPLTRARGPKTALLFVDGAMHRTPPHAVALLPLATVEDDTAPATP